MVRVSNTVVASLNVLFFLLGAALLGLGAYFHIHTAPTTCQKFLENSLFVLGAVVTLLSLLGLIGSYPGKNFLLVLYIFLMSLLAVALAVLAVFVFLITNEGAGKAVSNVGVREYRLGDYSNWLRNHFVKGKNWDVFRSCLVEAEACRAFTNGGVGPINATDFFKNNFSPIQSGCCKPPIECGFEYKNTTFWTMGDSGRQAAAARNNTDCTKWSNNKDELCYNCDSCKAGFLANIRKQWRNLAIAFLCLLLFVLTISSIGCCARKNNKYYKHHPRWGNA